MRESPVLRNAMTVDVEEHFQVQAFADIIRREDWAGLPSRVEANVERLLGLFADHGARATFFTLGWVAERHPAMVRRIVAAGHELASHGFWHGRVDRQTRDAFREDVTRAKAILEATGGVPVRGYRAPTFSIGQASPWAFDVLQETGHGYSSSVFPIRHDLYGAPQAPRDPFVPAPRLCEFPMTTVRLANRNVPCAGGGYFRLLPYAVFRAGLRRRNRRERARGIFYLHPWEIDPDQPRVRGARPLSRFRHSVNLGRTEARLRRALTDFRWDRMDEVFARELAENGP